MTYASKFKDPRWQKLRLEVLNESGWECEDCVKKDKTLNVHHKFYTKGSEPWEYDIFDFKVLCETCHSGLHDTLDKIKMSLGELTNSELGRLCGYIKALGDGPAETFVHTPEEAIGWCDYYRTTTAMLDEVKEQSNKRNYKAAIILGQQVYWGK